MCDSSVVWLAVVNGKQQSVPCLNCYYGKAADSKLKKFFLTFPEKLSMINYQQKVKALMVHSRNSFSCRERKSSAESFLKFR